MKGGEWLSIILAIFGLGISVTLTLIGIIFSWQKARMDRLEERMDKEIRELRAHTQDRFRSHGHEIRETNGNVTELFKMLAGKGKKD